MYTPAVSDIHSNGGFMTYRYVVIALAVLVGAALLVTACMKKETKDESAAPQAAVGAEKLVTTSSGLQYQVLQEGTGAVAKAGQRVSVHYTGWLTDGKKFDSSVDRGQPFQFALGAGQVIRGWDEGVAGMKIGEKRKLTIPSNLGYGANGAGAVIPPNATLVFDVELLGVQ
jgi:FKBP-type peptidyl-prolyl cis-trans isomerase FkpA